MNLFRRIVQKLIGFIFGAVLLSILIQVFSGEIWTFIQGHFPLLAGLMGFLLLLYALALLRERGFMGHAPRARRSAVNLRPKRH